MEVRYLMLARYAEFSSDGMVNILGGDNDKFIADDYPYIRPLLVAVARVVLNRTDSEHPHDFKAVIVDADTNDIIAEGVSGTIPTVVIPAEANFLETGMLLTFQHVIFPKAGLYVVHLLVDETVLAKARFRVAPVAYYQGLSRPTQSIQIHPLQKDESHA